VAAADWQALKTGAHNLKTRANEEWSKIASK
jgi:hypothetical protein